LRRGGRVKDNTTFLVGLGEQKAVILLKKKHSYSNYKNKNKNNK